jgi:hypothetical protein
MSTIDPWELVDEWQLEEGPDGELEQDAQTWGEHTAETDKIVQQAVDNDLGFNKTNLPPYAFTPDFVPVIQPAISIEEANRLNYASLGTLTCVICGKSFETRGILRVCTPCWDELKTMPKVYLHLVDSEKYEQGVVTWDHGNIGSQPHDPEAIPIGIWGKYGMEGEKLTYWVSLCKPVEAIHDMMTQFQAAVSERAALFKAQIKYADKTIDETGTGYKPQYTKSVRRVSKPVATPAPIIEPELSAADKMKKFLGR